MSFSYLLKIHLLASFSPSQECSANTAICVGSMQDKLLNRQPPHHSSVSSSSSTCISMMPELPAKEMFSLFLFVYKAEAYSCYLTAHHHLQASPSSSSSYSSILTYIHTYHNHCDILLYKMFPLYSSRNPII